MCGLEKVLHDLYCHIRKRLPISLTTDVHSFKPGDQVWIKEWNFQPLQPQRRRPYSVILTTPTAIKVVEITPWIHNTQMKEATPEWKSQLDSSDPLKLTLRRGPSALPQSQTGSWLAYTWQKLEESNRQTVNGLLFLMGNVLWWCLSSAIPYPSLFLVL
jgi:hypothetical protein